MRPGLRDVSTRGETLTSSSARPVGECETNVLIVGAGIAGLTAALALAKRGISSTLLERASELREAGAGLQLSPNALRVLDRLGLLNETRKRAVVATSVTLCDGDSGRQLARVPVGSESGTPYLSLHRADLQAILARRVDSEPLIEMILGAELVGIEGRTGSVGIRVKRRSGETLSLDTEFLIAADGVNSHVAALLELPPASFANAIAWRGRATGNAARMFAATSNGVKAWLGPKRHAVAYPIRSGDDVNLVLAEHARVASATNGDALKQRFAFRAPQLNDLIASVQDFTPWPIKVTPTDRPWSIEDGRVVLVGDAAHGMLPYAAQGAAMAIEDAYVLAAILAATADPSSVGADFERLRRARIERVRKRARFHGFVYHLPQPLSLARDLVMKVTPEARLRSSLGWLYDWVPPK